MRLFHLLASHDTDSRTGVPRWSGLFRDVFPETFNVTPGTVDAIEWREGDVCVTDNHLSLLVPDSVRTVVAHHGCAPYHYAVDPSWRNVETLRMAADQRLMFLRPNRVYVAPSSWVADRFAEVRQKDPKGPLTPTWIVPYWVPMIPRVDNRKFDRAWAGPGPDDWYKYEVPRRGVVIGDWRTANKGRDLWREVAALAPEFEFRQLDFDGDAARRLAYQAADAYLCLSLSEGGSLAMCDAEAASLPIVSTACGNVREFEPYVTEREPEKIAAVLRVALLNGRQRPSFYETWTREKFVGAWRRVIEEARR